MRSLSKMLIATLVFCSACGDSLTAPSSALESARQRWRTNGDPTYQFTIAMNCECLVTGPLRASVVNDSTVIATGASVDPRSVPNIKKLFAFIENGIANNAARLEVAYDGTLGFPAKIIYDGSAAAVDDEITYTVTDVSIIRALNNRR